MDGELITTDEYVPAELPRITPVQQLAHATEAADALMEFIEKGAIKPTVISGNKHLRVEHWLFLGQATGLHPVEEFCKRVEIDGVKGFHARTNVLDNAGHIVGSGEAFCMEDERNWKGRDLHAVASMAQTRSVSKALSSRLRWIVGLAGATFSTTPAEEMIVIVDDESPEEYVIKATPRREEGTADEVNVAGSPSTDTSHPTGPLPNPSLDVDYELNEPKKIIQDIQTQAAEKEFSDLAEEPAITDDKQAKQLKHLERITKIFDAAVQNGQTEAVFLAKIKDPKSNYGPKKSFGDYASNVATMIEKSKGGWVWFDLKRIAEIYGNEPWFPEDLQWINNM